MNTSPLSKLSRRSFVQLSGTAASAAVLTGLGANRVLGATAGSDKLRVGVIGCGGRGVGAARNCMDADPGVEIVSLGDLFPVQVEKARIALQSPEKKKGEVVTSTRTANVPPDRCFSGFDCYKKVLATDVDLVILAAPPGFRPSHFAAAVEAGKHVFMEKPAAVDPVGCRAIIAAAKVAKEKKLGVVAGTQRRHEPGYIEVMKRIQAGEMGELVGGQCYWNGGGIWFREKKDWLAELSDFEWQCYNWYHWDWICGDHIVEQHMHNIDIMNWAFGGPPAKFQGMGGRQNRGNIPGNIWDHFAVEMEYPNGARVLSMCRHAPKTATRVSERLVGTKGTSDCKGTIKGEKPFAYSGANPNPYVVEHEDLIKSIRSGNPLNEGEQVAISTLTAIGGRMAAYTGRELSWNWLLNSSKLDIFPKECKPGPGLFPPIPVPGVTELI
ncbi:MAG: Gfo/Idh/MocA family oxidoreductase [Opitutae bacterium]|nr:Gfo/Idh/MocA family oxidoreductase [Opitutae bacterium]